LIGRLRSIRNRDAGWGCTAWTSRAGGLAGGDVTGGERGGWAAHGAGSGQKSSTATIDVIGQADRAIMRTPLHDGFRDAIESSAASDKPDSRDSSVNRDGRDDPNCRTLRLVTEFG
jgi:hypothetical protein